MQIADLLERLNSRAAEMTLEAQTADGLERTVLLGASRAMLETAVIVGELAVADLPTDYKQAAE